MSKYERTESRCFEKITPQQMESIRVAWSIFNSFGGLGVLLGMSGIVALSLILKNTTARLFAWVALVTALVAIFVCMLFIILRINVVNFQETTLGLNQGYLLSDWAFIHIVGPISMLATVSISIRLFTTGLLRRTGIVVAVLSGILLILSIVRQFPPFVFSPVWLVLGIALMLKVGHRQAPAKVTVS